MIEPMKKRIVILLLVLAFAAGVQAQSSYQNFGVITNPPPINAVNIDNYGNFVIASSGTAPFDTENTRQFINHPTGTMLDLGGGGFRFNLLSGDNNYVPAMADLFSNSGQIVTPGRIDVLADTVRIQNLGLLSADRRGALSVIGNDVSLFNGRLRAGEASDRVADYEGGFFVNGLQYENPLNVREDAWGVTQTNTPMISLSSLASFPGLSPSHLVQVPPGFPASGEFESGQSVYAPTPNFYLDSDFFFPNMGNIQATVNAVFVETNAPGMPDLTVGFYNSTNSANFPVQATVIEFSMTDIDPITGAPFTRNLTLTDESSEVARPAAALSAHFLQENSERTGRMRPRAHVLTRADGALFGSFVTPQPPQDYDPDMIYPGRGNFNGAFDNRTTNYQYSSSTFTVNPYDFSDGGLGGIFEGNPGAVDRLQDLTNAPGRVEIVADQLDLTLASVRAESYLTIAANNLVGSEDVVLDAPNISLELLATNGSTTISNFFPATVNRMHGEVEVWSGVWLVNQGITNQAPATYDPFRNGFASWIGSNTINYAYHMTIVNHDLSTNYPVTVQKLRVNSGELILSDPVTINDRFFFEGTNFTFAPADTNDALVFTTEHPLVNAENLPNLLKFTNNGIISVPQQANFGFDRSTAYECVVNNGTMQSGSLLFKSGYFENTNILQAFNGSIFIDAATNRLHGGVVSASETLSLSGEDAAITNATIAARRIFFDVKQRLSDEDVTNTWTVTGGFGMLSTPTKGDLLSTEIVSQAGTNSTTVHQWAGEDRGDDPAGYANNAAIGRLTLDGAPGGRFYFGGAGGSDNALYVDTIQLNNYATNFETSVTVASNFKLYFAYLVDTNNTPLPADKFEEAHGGRVVWVGTNTRSGPVVSIATGIGQSTNMTTQAMRALLPAGGDYDGDGIRNSDDTTPLSGFTVNQVSTAQIAETAGSEPKPHAKIVWQSLPNTTYLIEYRDSVGDGDWKPLTYLISVSSGEMTAYDPLPQSGQRFYRVRYSR